MQHPFKGRIRRHWPSLLVCLAIPLLTGGLSSLLTREGMKAFSALRQPPLSPPQWLFPIAWTLLYLMMGLASWLCFTSGAPRQPRRLALGCYGAQLLFNFFWTLFFFAWGLHLFAFCWLLALWVLIGLTMRLFFPLERAAGLLLLPYWVWVTFAAYLNLGVYWLNQGG